MIAVSEKLLSADGSEADELRNQLGKVYIDYYRSRVLYIMQNSRSLTVVPVLFQSLTETLPVFGQATDAIHFNNAADTLETVYPDSKYVKALSNFVFACQVGCVLYRCVSLTSPKEYNFCFVGFAILPSGMEYIFSPFSL
jgi:hypothetical protein